MVSVTASPSQITAVDELFTITWTTSGTTVAHICRLGIRPAQAGDEAIDPLGEVACDSSRQHAPTGEGDFNYVVAIHEGSGGAPIAQGTSNTVTRKIPDLGNTLWTRQFGSDAGDYATSVATDEAGNIIITGYTFGALEGTNAGSTDAFVRKYDPNGGILWTRQFGTNLGDQAVGIATDVAGNIIVSGWTTGGLEGTNAGVNDAFVRKYDPNGDILWTHQFGTNVDDYVHGVATDAAGNIIVTGATYGALEGANAGEFDAFVRKYDPNGGILWTRQIGTIVDDSAQGVATDATGAIIITGYTDGPLEGASAGGRDAYVRKYDADGNILWARQFGSNTSDSARGVASDAAGNVIITGETYGALEGTNAGDYDAFARKYDPNGTTLWTRQFGSNTSDSARGVASDAAGNVIITGETYGALEGTNAGDYDAFARKYDPNGTALWTRQFGTSGDDKARGVATDAAGNIIVTGETYGALEGTNAGDYDAFLRKYDPNGLVLWTHQFGTDARDSAWGVVSDATRNIMSVGYTWGLLEGSSAGGADAFIRKFTR